MWTKPNQKNSFLIAPLIAAFSWYLYVLVRIAIVNGGLRGKPDVLAFFIGTMAIGLPLAYLSMLILGLPLYAVMRKLGLLQFAPVLVAGGVIGAITGYGVVQWTHEPWMLSPLLGGFIGLISSAGWWRIYKKQGKLAWQGTVGNQIDER